MITIVNTIPSYLITVTASVAFFIALKLFQTFIHSKVLHAKTQQARELWSYIDQASDTAVSSLVNANLTGDEKFAKATEIVQSALNRQGFTNVDVKAIEAAIQAAYEKSPLTPTVEPTLGLTTKTAIPAGQAPAIDPLKGDK